MVVQTVEVMQSCLTGFRREADRRRRAGRWEFGWRQEMIRREAEYLGTWRWDLELGG